MNRRSFLLSAAAGASVGLGWAGRAEAQNTRPIDPAQRTMTAPKIEVLYFFDYEQPHCLAFEPKLVAWKAKQSDVTFLRSPVERRLTSISPRLFYSLEAHKLDLHHKVLEALHVENGSLRTVGEVQDWLKKQQVRKQVIDAFPSTWSSFGVESAMQQARNRSQAYKLRGVPALAVDGRFITDAGDHAQMLVMTDYVLARIRAEKNEKK